MDFIALQFGHPRGFVGRMVGTIMAVDNRERNAWAVSLLAVQPDDHVLEIGFGPGLAIQQIAESVVDGLVAGVDHSDVMVRQACKRNAATIQEGRVELRQGSVSALPYEDNSFDKVLAVNSVHHWPDQAEGLKESRRVLKPGGLIVIVEQPRSGGTEAIREISEDMAGRLTAAEFHQVRSAFKPMKPATSIGVLGIK